MQASRFCACCREETSMPKYRSSLPQIADRLFLTDGGIETSLIYKDGFQLPYFAAFDLLKSDEGVAGVRRYFEPYLRIARERGLGIVLESPTWRANPDWAAKLGYSEDDLAVIQRRSIELLAGLRAEYETERTPVVISGCIGPRGDGYNPDRLMSSWEADAYHAPEVRTYAETEADLVTAITMNYAEEAIGVARAAVDAGMPVVISFTVETDGKLPTGQTLKDAILQVDAETDNAPAYYMINCAHPTHFADLLRTREPWLKRLRGLRANASRKSHAELDAATTLDAGDPVELGRRYADLRRSHRGLTVLGGCCGTDARHIEQIGLACMAAEAGEPLKKSA
jgi:S-methylmethionine-dependent homocysteine/selenocysteine methylase